MKKSPDNLSDYTDEKILTLLQNGDEDAFTCIYEKYNQMLYVLAYNYLKDKEMAKDATQQVFLKLWESHLVLHIRINLRNYLHTMLKNYILNEIRNNYTALAKNYELSQQYDNFEDILLSRIEEKEISDALYEAIDKLPEQKKQVCLYKLKEDISNQEIAERMDITIPTVKTHYSQAIKILRTHLKKLLLFLYTF